MRNSRLLPILLVLLILAAPAPLFAADKTLGEGEGLFRAVDLPTLISIPLPDDQLTKADRAYLGLAKTGPFTVKDVKAELVFVEFLNVYCYACNMQAPVLDQVVAKVAARADLKGRVRFLGIGVGNNAKEIAAFKEKYDIPFPIVADAKFEAWEQIGNPGGTPFMVLWAPKPAKGGAVTKAQLGLMRDVNAFITAIDSALAGSDAAEPTYYKFTAGEWRNLKSTLTPAQLDEKLKAAAAAAGLAGAKVEPASGEEGLYKVTAGGKTLWAKVAGRAKICNVCHDIFFIVLFDNLGKIVGFEPITVTKYNNVAWDANDSETMRKRIVGRSMGEAMIFDPEVDAVSTATMSAQLIFDTLRRLGASYKGMKEKGLIK
jgi:thiol-disulfide isomerase/thioredoxin